MYQKLTLLVVIGLAGCATSKPAAPAPPARAAPAWEVPAGWKQETIPFPLDFAPELPHRGVEILRFAPGFFDPTQPGYWSYAWAWWLEDAQVPGRSQLELELARYFRGLSKAVGDEKHLTFDPARFRAQLRDEPILLPGWTAYRGELDSVDAFTTGKPITLHVRIGTGACPRAGRRVVLVAASPRAEAETDPVWSQLEALFKHFPCD